jgi:predicted Rossmann fold flavoprotein
MVNAFDVVILGGGAAGLMCAIEAGKRGRRVAILERADRIGKKILISGGGRCNFTNLDCKPENFLSGNPHFCKSALSRYSPSDFIALVERYRIPYHEKTRGQLFCDRSARDIVSMLEEECRQSNVRIYLNVNLEDVRVEGTFVATAGTQQFEAGSLVVATGGISIPKIGATGFGYEIARKFRLKVRPCFPALVPLTFNASERERYADLAGVSSDVHVTCGGQSFRDKMLFTHRGISGPAILQISSYWSKPESLVLDLAPEVNLTLPIRKNETRRDIGALKSALREHLPQRLADRWLEKNPPPSWTNRGLEQWEAQLHAWQLKPDGTEGFEKAEVTAGGVDTSELSSKTMECSRVRGLYFIGEVVDVTGQLGGFNFQWAWASGAQAGRAV